jgi:hypothetical protein
MGIAAATVRQVKSRVSRMIAAFEKMLRLNTPHSLVSAL